MTHVPGKPKFNYERGTEMSKHNYTQYSNKKRSFDNPVANPGFVETTVVSAMTPPSEVDVVEETVETVTLPKMVTGVVVNCAKLNVRETPSISGEVVCVLNAASEFEIDVNGSNREWFKICTASGVDGYCMRKYVNAQL